MPISLRGAKILKELTNMDFRVLNMIETLLRKGEYAPVDKIVTYSGYRAKDVDLILSKLNKMKLTRRWKGQFVGYSLSLSGFDALALNTLYNKKIIYGVGQTRGVGKESDIYHAIDFEENEIMIKINRTGRASFQQIKKKRDFLKNKFHYSMFSTAEIAAKREYKILKELKDKKLPIPDVKGHNRHIIAMEVVEGRELINVQYLKKPIKTLESIIEFAKILYQKYNIVHADLTEYNILYNEENSDITIIDFPQAVHVDHLEDINLLTRDFTHLLEYFGKKWGITTDEVDTVIDYIIGKK
ncbi:MAG: RIO-type serine/threonine-protein kinase Rio2 [Candidatus Heimdallarchaeota archaeon AB_125]|nr:MAG: RIO-type serine/threonine-protein kinase Rio2 [Candidatus Heimdallarchaeota archaeon AB_125]